MNIMLFGPQGSGKGTQARLLSEKYGFFYFESGAYLRRIADKYPDLKKTMSEGNLVPDKEMTSYLTAYLDQEGLYDDILFDGFPRTLEQYNFLKNWLEEKQVKIDLGIVIEISESESIRRLGGRRQDPKTGEIYNIITEKIPEGIDVSSLVQREDDKPDSIKRRLSLYRTRTDKLISELKEEMKVIEVNGERPVDIIFSDLTNEIERLKNENKN